MTNQVGILHFFFFLVLGSQAFNNLDLEGRLAGLDLLEGLVLGLGAHDTTTPLTAGLVVLLNVALLDGRDELGELVLVLRADLGDGEDGSGLSNKNC